MVLTAPIRRRCWDEIHDLIQPRSIQMRKQKHTDHPDSENMRPSCVVQTRLIITHNREVEKPQGIQCVWRFCRRIPHKGFNINERLTWCNHAEQHFGVPDCRCRFLTRVIKSNKRLVIYVVSHFDPAIGEKCGRNSSLKPSSKHTHKIQILHRRLGISTSPGCRYRVVPQGGDSNPKGGPHAVLRGQGSAGHWNEEGAGAEDGEGGAGEERDGGTPVGGRGITLLRYTCNKYISDGYIYIFKMIFLSLS